MSQTKQEKPLGEKIKDFFKTRSSSKSEISAESLSSISAEQPVSCRLQAIKELQGLVKEKKIQQNCVEQLWIKVSDLLEDTTNNGTETRHAVLDFIIDLVTSQYPSLDVMRLQFFGLVKKHTVEEDVNHRIRLLDALTQNGTNIHHFQDEIGPVLVQLLRVSTEQLADCSLILSVIFNVLAACSTNSISNGSSSSSGASNGAGSSCISPDTLMHLIGILSSHASNTKSDSEVHQILEIYKSMVQHTSIPSEAYLQFTACLSRVVNIEQVRLDALITMRSLLGTQMGQSSLGDLCSLIQSSPDQQEDELLIRGALFFIGSCLWGPHSVPSLKYSVPTILPVFLVALKDGQPQVVLEASAQILSLVQLQGTDLGSEAWQKVIKVMLAIKSGFDSCQEEPVKLQIQNNIKETLSCIDELITKNKFTGDRGEFCDLVECMYLECSQQCVIHLITYRFDQNVRPSKENWIEYLTTLMTKFYDEELRVGVRVHLLAMLQTSVKKYLSYAEDQIIMEVIIKFLGCLDSEVDRNVKVEAVKTISEFAVQATGNHQGDLMDVLENIVKTLTDITPVKNEDSDGLEELVLDETTKEKLCSSSLGHVTEAVMGIVKVFKSKFFAPPILAVKRCYEVMVTLLDRFYSIPQLLEFTGDVRYEIFRCFLSLRARQDFHLGYHKDGRGCVIFSPFVVCESKQGFFAKDKDMLVLSLTRACRAVIRCFKEDNDWRVLQLLLNQVPSVLQNRGMLLRYEESISKLAEALCGLVQNGYKLPDKNVPAKFSRIDFNLTLYPVLAALASYNRWLNSGVKKILIASLESGLLLKECSKVCTVALTSCILEMSDSMNTFLPEVLWNLSKISATVHVAIPVLEFLSTLISLPKVFASFTNDQYRSVFAITLPFTNPFKFNHYTVSLAHHVIIMWFLKCRMSSRKDFVKFIVKGLEGNALQPFEEGNFRKRAETLAAQNEDSSNRARSSSLNEESRPSRTRNLTGVPTRPNLQHKQGPDERQALHLFHQELTQTCLDMMTRYSNANPSLEPERSSLANILLKSGTSSSWLIDTAILTISVNGCSSSGAGNKTADTNLCQSCAKGCGSDDPINKIMEKKRHLSEQPVRSRLLHQPLPTPLIQDDALLHERSNRALQTSATAIIKPRLQQQQQMKQLQDAENQDNTIATNDTLNNGEDNIESLDKVGSIDLNNENTDEDADMSGSLEDLRKLSESYDQEMAENTVDANVENGNDDTAEHEKGSGEKEKGNDEGQVKNDQDKNVCPCWCQGWCEILIRRPSGEMSWMCRIRNGQLTSNNFSLTDVGSILFPDVDIQTKIKVSRSNSDPEIMDKLTPLDLTRIKSMQVCQPIPEEGNSGAHRISTSSPRHRPRSNTIDSSSPTKPIKRMDRLLLAKKAGNAAMVGGESPVNGEGGDAMKPISPEHMFDQIVQAAGMRIPLASDQCLPIPKSRPFESSIRILDMIPCQETHKIGVIYVGHGQANKETEILGNTEGSPRYQAFLQGLGSLISLSDYSSGRIFLGGLSEKDGDGECAYVWLDDAMQVVYHTATLMPNRDTDPQFNKKKRHIGNDYVAIVYNDSGEAYQMGTVKGQFIYATVVVEPLDFESNRISVLAKPELYQFLSHLTQGKVVSDLNLSMLVRQIALHCNLAANIYSNIEKKADLYASNWLERLRHIKRLKAKLQKEQDESLKDYNII